MKTGTYLVSKVTSIGLFQVQTQFCTTWKSKNIRKTILGISFQDTRLFEIYKFWYMILRIVSLISHLPNIVQKCFCTPDRSMDPTFKIKYTSSRFNLTVIIKQIPLLFETPCRFCWVGALTIIGETEIMKKGFQWSEEILVCKFFLEKFGSK